MTIKSIMIPKVNTIYTADHIAFTLLTKEICHVSSITLIPQIYDAEIYNIAYIDIYSYCDTEAAYEFILYIKNGVFKLLHDNDHDNIWDFQINTHNNGLLSIGSFTTKFHYKLTSQLLLHEHEHELLHDSPIIGPDNQHYSLQQALDYFHLLNQQWHSVNTAIERRLIEKNIHHLDNELRIHHSVYNSQHITIR
jgi:hypothetical protein